MNEHLAKPLEAWHGFYIVVGPGAAALTGLLFGIVSPGPYGLALAMPLFIVTAIRNAWDRVLWVAQQPRPEASDPRTGGLIEGPAGKGHLPNGR